MEAIRWLRSNKITFHFLENVSIKATDRKVNKMALRFMSHLFMGFAHQFVIPGTKKCNCCNFGPVVFSPQVRFGGKHEKFFSWWPRNRLAKGLIFARAFSTYQRREVGQNTKNHNPWQSRHRCHWTNNQCQNQKVERRLETMKQQVPSVSWIILVYFIHTEIFASNFAVWKSVSYFTSTNQRGETSFSHVQKSFRPITNHGLSESCFRGLFRGHRG